MATHTGNTAAGHDKRILVAALGAAVVVVAGSGLEIWRLSGHSGGTAATSSSVQSRAPRQGVLSGSISAVTSGAAVQAAPPPQVFLVSVAAEAATADEMRLAASRNEGQAGISPASTALQVSPATTALDVMQAFGFENDQRLARGLAPIQVQDLRDATGAGNGTASPTVSTFRVEADQAPTMMLVGSANHAAAVQRMLEDSAGVSGQAGLSLAYDTVFEVSQQTSAADVLAAFGFENEQRLARGLPPIKVSDLR